MKNSKILIASPTSKHKDYCFKGWSAHLKKLTYQADILLVDNTKDSGQYAKTVLSKHFKTIHIDWKQEDNLYSIITKSQNIIRNYTLYYRYEFLFLLESDQMPNYNVIEYLLSLNKRVCSLPYFTYTAFQSKVLQFDTEDFGQIRQGHSMNLDKSFLNWDGITKPKMQPGLGCILIHRSVLEKIKFRCDTDHASDTFFHEDLNKLGIQCYCSELYFSEHHNSNWFNILKK
jgi:hypothetical protein